MPKILIYIVGLIPLALFQHWLRDAFGDLVGLLVIIVYLVMLRLAAERWGNAA